MDWDEFYKGTPAWDIGHPQRAFEALLEDGEIKPGRALDIGCGRGDNAIMLAMTGCDVTGIDLSEIAVSDARAKAAELHVNVNFVVGDVLRMDQLFNESKFDVVIDSFLFHTLQIRRDPFLPNRSTGCLNQEVNISCSVFPTKILQVPDLEGSQKLK